MYIQNDMILIKIILKCFEVYIYIFLYLLQKLKHNIFFFVNSIILNVWTQYPYTKKIFAKLIVLLGSV